MSKAKMIGQFKPNPGKGSHFKAPWEGQKKKNRKGGKNNAAKQSKA